MPTAELFMIRYKRRYGQTWYYRPAVYQGEEGKAEAIRQANLGMKSIPTSKALYACEVVRMTADIVHQGSADVVQGPDVL